MYQLYQQEDEALKRGMDIARSQGAEALEQERQAREQAEREQETSMRGMLAGLESQAVRSFAELEDAYEARQEAAKAALDAIAKFAEIEAGIRARESQILGGLHQALALMPANRVPGKIAQIRKQAGIPVQHDDLEIDPARTDWQRTAQTVLRGIALGNIGTGYIRAGRITLNI